MNTIDYRPLAGALGAEIFGLNLSAPLTDENFAELHRLLVDYGVLCIRDQQLTPPQQVAFARRFGELDVHPIVSGTDEIPELVRVLKPAGQSASFGVGWHSDNSFFEKPSLGSVLYGVTIPPYGGDTLYASMEKAYDALSQPMKQFLAPLVAVHSASRAYDPKVTGEHKYRGEAPISYRYDEQAIYSEVRHPV
ncbi:MAG TPA: TauD/TfdA family dioxygenase, partial [Terriglobales bacterium]|nr:TauD/TfdA family dioxygenase [Terriglobales bacterium]